MSFLFLEVLTLIVACYFAKEQAAVTMLEIELEAATARITELEAKVNHHLELNLTFWISTSRKFPALENKGAASPRRHQRSFTPYLEKTLSDDTIVSFPEIAWAI